jgi:hypothetical protein
MVYEGTGHVPALMYCMAWLNVQTPLAAEVVGATGDLVIKPPMYF